MVAIAWPSSAYEQGAAVLCIVSDLREVSDSGMLLEDDRGVARPAPSPFLSRIAYILHLAWCLFMPWHWCLPSLKIGARDQKLCRYRKSNLCCDFPDQWSYRSCTRRPAITGSSAGS